MNGSKAKEQQLEGWEVIHVYSREQAILDGVLVDVTQTAKEAGIMIPVAVTQGVWSSYVEVPDGVSMQDEAGRLWDILWMTRYALQGSRKRHAFTVRLFVQNDNKAPKRVTLRAFISQGDDGKPALTITLPHED